MVYHAKEDDGNGFEKASLLLNLSKITGFEIFLVELHSTGFLLLGAIKKKKKKANTPGRNCMLIRLRCLPSECWVF